MRVAVRAAMSSERFVRFAGRGRSANADAALDPQIAAALEFARITKLPPLESMTPAAARRFAESGMSPLDLDTVPMAKITDTVAGGIAVRIFEPHDAGPNWLVYFHGGGGVIGSIAASEPVTRYLAAQTRCTVASVEYRLGPEDKHPSAIGDACAAYAALANRVPTGGRLAVGGDSFGGYLSVQVERLSKRRPDLQVLIYPLVDMTLTSPSIERHADGYLLTKSMIHWFRGHYLHDTDDHRTASPWFWSDLAGTAPAIVVTAGYDPLVDEGDAWARRLREAGTKVIHRRHGSLVHGFVSMGGAVRAARAATDELCADIVELLRS
ncbi:MAG: Alpha/beta hydrolase fold-3 domain protein [Myxococcales bacterium]|nr:Alpha/beta hydrolase fold-3 domain protein [Myxococcales bacterium]